MDKFRRAQIDHQFATRVMECRDLLGPIVKGEIERVNCPAGTRECYGGVKGERKTTLKDAVRIAKIVTMLMDRAINEFEEEIRNEID